MDGAGSDNQRKPSDKEIQVFTDGLHTPIWSLHEKRIEIPGSKETGCNIGTEKIEKQSKQTLI